MVSLLSHVLIDDPKAKNRSLMHKKPSLCNGQATGAPCVHYWFHTQKVESNNPDELKDGEKHRACLISPGFPVEFSDEEIPHVCNQYRPRKLPGLKGLLGFTAQYNAADEEYSPLSPEEVAALRAADPTPPPPELDAFGQFAAAAAARKSLPIVGQDDTAATQADVKNFLDSLEKK